MNEFLGILACLLLATGTALVLRGVCSAMLKLLKSTSPQGKLDWTDLLKTVAVAAVAAAGTAAYNWLTANQAQIGAEYGVGPLALAGLAALVHSLWMKFTGTAAANPPK